MLEWYFILFFSVDHVLTVLQDSMFLLILRQGILTACTLTSSRLDEFADIVTCILSVMRVLKEVGGGGGGGGGGGSDPIFHCHFMKNPISI